MKITAIITNYNQGRFINASFGSLLSQTHKPDEIIIVDDKSTDNSVQLIEDCIGKYKGPIPIKFIQRETNGKPAGCRNSGIKEATGDIIAFLDIDDYYTKDKISESIQIFQRFPEVGLVYSDYFRIEQSGKVVREFKHPYDYNFLQQVCIVSTNSIVRKEALLKCNLFNENPDYAGVEDYEMWLKISFQYLLMHIPKPLFNYRLHGDNLTLRENTFMPQRVANMKRNLQNEYNSK